MFYIKTDGNSITINGGEEMSKHTPAPWRVGFSSFTVEAGSMKICDIRGWGHLTGTGGLNLPHDKAKEVQDANADLIAAAPELLSALKDIFQMMDEQILVRNTEHDHKPEWAGLAIGTATRLKFAFDAIEKAEGKK